MFVILRETSVLCLGVIVAAGAALTCRLWGNRLELLPGIVVPICFCLGRLSFMPGYPKNISSIRQALYQMLRAFALIMLLLFEMGVGLFIEADDIPAVVWGIVACLGIFYIISILVAESLPTSSTHDCLPDGGEYMQRF